LKIALVHYAAAPIIGGVERVMEEHARLFAAHGHEVTIFAGRGGGQSVGVVYCDFGEAFGELRAQLPAHDVVFVHNVLTMPFQMGLTIELLTLAKQNPNLRVVAWTHDVAAANPDLLPVEDVLCHADSGIEYVAVSELRRNQLAEHLCVTECAVIPNGVDTAKTLGISDELNQIVQKFAILDGRTVFLHPTRLLQRKNVECSIELVRALGDSVLLVTGAEDPHNADSQKYASMLRRLAGRETIFVSDHLPVGDADLAGLYRLADALIFPSRQEGFGLPMLEARLHRLPIIHSSIEPLNALAGGRAFSVGLGESPNAIARRLRLWLHSIPEIADRAAVLRDYSWDAVFKKHIVPLLDGMRVSTNK
jgi:mannosylglucosylglycerate synthase